MALEEQHRAGPPDHLLPEPIVGAADGEEPHCGPAVCKEALAAAVSATSGHSGLQDYNG